MLVPCMPQRPFGKSVSPCPHGFPTPFFGHCPPCHICQSFPNAYFKLSNSMPGTWRLPLERDAKINSLPFRAGAHKRGIRHSYKPCCVAPFCQFTTARACAVAAAAAVRSRSSSKQQKWRRTPSLRNRNPIEHSTKVTLWMGLKLPARSLAQPLEHSEEVLHQLRDLLTCRVSQESVVSFWGAGLPLCARGALG